MKSDENGNRAHCKAGLESMWRLINMGYKPPCFPDLRSTHSSLGGLGETSSNPFLWLAPYEMISYQKLLDSQRVKHLCQQ